MKTKYKTEIKKIGNGNFIAVPSATMKGIKAKTGDEVSVELKKTDERIAKILAKVEREIQVCQEQYDDYMKKYKANCGQFPNADLADKTYNAAMYWEGKRDGYENVRLMINREMKE